MAKNALWHFSRKEQRDLLISWVTLSIAFAIVISPSFLGFFSDLEALLIAFVSVGTGFVFHELAHRQAARSFGFVSEFRMWKEGLIIALGIAVISMGNLVFAAPGATYFFGTNVTREQNGKISIAGPITNIIVGFVLVSLLLVAPNVFIGKIIFNAAWINFWFAFFNLLPIFPLDGAKVLAWNPGAWVVTIAVAGLMSFMPGILLALIGV